MKIHQKNTSRGFTLIELLVAMAITTIIVTILVSVTALSLDTWNRSRSEVRASRQGEAMIDSMARDFESLVVRKGNNFEWLSADSDPSSEGPNGNSSPNSVDLVFFSAATDRYDGQVGVDGVDLGGDVSTIAYQLRYKDPIDGDEDDDFKTFVLYRKIVNPDTTFGNAALAGTLGKTDLQAAFSTAISGSAVDDEVNFICENIYQFTVTFHVDVTITDTSATPATSETVSVAVPVGQQSGDQTSLFSITGSGIVTDYKPANSDIGDDQLKSGRVTAVEISLTVLSDFGLKQMRNRSFSDTDPDEFDEFIAKNSYQFSKLIPVPGS